MINKQIFLLCFSTTLKGQAPAQDFFESSVKGRSVLVIFPSKKSIPSKSKIKNFLCKRMFNDIGLQWDGCLVYPLKADKENLGSRLVQVQMLIRGMKNLKEIVIFGKEAYRLLLGACWGTLLVFGEEFWTEVDGRKIRVSVWPAYNYWNKVRLKYLHTLK